MRINESVLKTLDLCKTEGQKLFIIQQLDRASYTALNKVLEAAGGKWDKKAKAHVFACDAGDRISQIIETGEVTVPRDEFDFFPTPLPVVQRLLDLAGIEATDICLEPSAGHGAIASEMAKLAKVECYEIQKECCEVLRSKGLTVTEADFLKVTPEEKYDKIVMNPPFGKQADIRHVSHAYGFLKPDGVLVAVMSPSFTFRTNKLSVDFKNFVDENGAWEELPQNSFKTSGTGVNTVIVKLTK